MSIRINYITKCRVCGHTTEWAGIPDDDQDYKSRFARQEWKSHRMTVPDECRCEECERDTVQDTIQFITTKQRP